MSTHTHTHNMKKNLFYLDLIDNNVFKNPTLKDLSLNSRTEEWFKSPITGEGKVWPVDWSCPHKSYWMRQRDAWQWAEGKNEGIRGWIEV